MKAILIALAGLILCTRGEAQDAVPRISHDPAEKTVTIQDGSGSLRLRLSYNEQCVVDMLRMGEKELLSNRGVRSTLTPTDARQPALPTVSADEQVMKIEGIPLRGSAAETWILKPLAEGIQWTIERTADSALTVDEAFTPEWTFARITDWTGALLGNGGVAWFSLFDSADATYGVHTSEVLLWKKGERRALRIAARSPSEDAVAVRFTRRKNNELSVAFSLSPSSLLPKHDQGVHRRRYLPARTDVWAPFTIPPGTSSVEYLIRVVDFEEAYGPGQLAPFDGEEIQMIASTVARIGVIDSRLHGGNSWRTPYGPICLHEQYIGQLGLIMQDSNYFNDYKQTLDLYRDRAIMADGRVKSRWAYTCEDAMPGTCDSLGFYEAQWGYLLDSNPDFVTNVAELFDFTGDWQWLRGQKVACEKALDYMLARDSDRDGLVEMMTDDHRAERGSDWIDVIWASYENAFVNAKLFYALTLWSDVEQLLGDSAHASAYRARASLLKSSFNRSTDQGGLWSPSHQWYVHWRDRDNSIHGDNLVTFVNFMAIAYGVCDDRERAAAILRSIEEQMLKEDLFFWPICMFSYQPGEGISWQFPFPVYENGDIFLSLGEVGVRAYKDFDPAIPVKYITRLIARYERDGLAFQRYLRKNQEGSGDDILAGNALPIVGLYRNIYGIQPKYNRLYIEPHITPELAKTAVLYRLRGQKYEIRPALDGGATVRAGAFELSDSRPFGVHSRGDTLLYFSGKEAVPSMTAALAGTAAVAAGLRLTVAVRAWESAGIRQWAERSPGALAVAHNVRGLRPSTACTVTVDGKSIAQGRSDPEGAFAFTLQLEPDKEHKVEVKQIP